jgi:hypothetical protein
MRRVGVREFLKDYARYEEPVEVMNRLVTIGYFYPQGTQGDIKAKYEEPPNRRELKPQARPFSPVPKPGMKK